MTNFLAFRANAYPLYLFAVLIAIFLLCVLVCGRSQALAGLRRVIAAPERLLSVCAWILAGSYLLLVLYYLCSALPFDNGETEHICTSFWFKSGHPLYHAPDAAERYSVGYGPMAYIPFALAMTLFGHSYLACKVLSVSCGLVYLFVTYRCFEKLTNARAALLWTALVMMLSVAHWWQTFYAKADPVLYLCVIMSLWAGAFSQPRAAILVFAFALGVAINIKLPAILYFSYPLMLLAQRLGWRSVAAVFGIGGVLAAGPFFHHHISFLNWIYWLDQERRQGFGENELKWNLQWFLFLLLLLLWPFVTARVKGRPLYKQLNKSDKCQLLVLLTSLVLMALSASKAGSGPNHLVPFVPLLCWAAIIVRQKQSPCANAVPYPRRAIAGSLAAAYVATALLLAIHAQALMFVLLRSTSSLASAVNADEEMIIAAYPGKSIAMGTGESKDYYVANQRLPLLFAGQPYCLDQTALMGHQAAGIAIPPATLEILSHRKIDLWLIPKHSPPFDLENFYPPPHRKVFDEKFRQTFFQNYEWRGASRFFDIYQARN